ncbi:MAG: hypothetical protein F6K35_41580 [Okeania sp. SIO2H7]|nr:hypothetical protein [Okeania sp. SIO2H7]
MIRKKLPNLEQFLSGYFHEDWKVQATDAEAVIQLYLNDGTTSIVPQVINEIDRLLGMNLSEEQLSDILIYDLGCCYDPQFQGMSDVEWLRWVRTSLKQGISKAAIALAQTSDRS